MSHFLAGVVWIERGRRVKIEKRPCIHLLLSRGCSDARWSRIVFYCRGLEKFRLRIEARAGDSQLCVVVIDSGGRGILKNGDAWEGTLWRMCGLRREGIEGIDQTSKMKKTNGQDTQHRFVSTAPTSSLLAPPAPPAKKQSIVCTLNIAPQLHPSRNTNK